MRIRELVNLTLLVLMSPLVGYEEAIRLIGDNVELTKGGKALLTMARHYEQSGISYDAYFEFLNQRFSNMVEDWRRMSSEVNLSVLMLTTALIMLEALMIMLIGAGLADSILVIAPLMLIPLIHVNQLKLYDYDYVKPTVIGFASALILYLSTRSLGYTILAFSLGFSILYMPQFLNFIRLITNLERKIMEPILELTWNPNPREITGSSIIEREFSRIRDIAYSIGAPYFVTRAARVVDSLVFQIRVMFRDNVVYGLLIPINYIALIEFLKFINSTISATAVNASLASPFNYHVPSIILLASALTTSMLTGKVIHSIGLGLSIMCLFLIPLLTITPIRM
ncbi:hypothetical protein [Caldivirga maquilingensis]|uniref:Uncharacterized protein n=1 Tax=Caldivirga maquilingensis (strain ATCC 700844 / DSM 13496 / JCM 10307 / IC-167) TaxID=397948 RepID=A8MBB8_CALMQ|nr:hypothetical protein [Caldivirga maquilingensis]ABW01208.1 hypothetical protein Cmaq_0362 [Caldivirga maquilingensis IC-167]